MMHSNSTPSLADDKTSSEGVYNLSTFASALLHELRNPLTTVVLILHELRRTEKNGLSEDLDLLYQETERIKCILQQFADFATPKQPVLESVHPDDLLSKIHEEWLPRMQERKIILKSQLTSDGMSTFDGDPRLLRKAIGNLIENAIESVPQNGSISVKVRTRQVIAKTKRVETIVFSVEDDGLGITPEVQNRILEPFFSTRKQKVGLGLPITKLIVQQHSGELSFKSEPGRGSKFEIVLPTIQESR